jgi:hypothetical protein
MPQIIEKVADDRLRVILYHIPMLTGVPISHELIAMLVKEFPDTVVGIKDSDGKIENMHAISARFPGFGVLAGADPLLLPVLQGGGAGCITASSNLVARELRVVYDHWNDPAKAAEVKAAQDIIVAWRNLTNAYTQLPGDQGDGRLPHRRGAVVPHPPAPGAAGRRPAGRPEIPPCRHRRHRQGPDRMTDFARPLRLHQPRRVEFGKGTAAEVGAWATAQGFQRILVLTQATMRPMLDRLGLPGRVEVFDGVRPEPDTDNLDAALAAARAAAPDLVVGFGGGSVMDLAKLVADAARRPGAGRGGRPEQGGRRGRTRLVADRRPPPAPGPRPASAP